MSCAPNSHEVPCEVLRLMERVTSSRKPDWVSDESFDQESFTLYDMRGRNSRVLAESGFHCTRKSARMLWPLSRAYLLELR